MAQVGTDYTYITPATTTPTTKRKITTLAKKDPALAEFIASIFGIGSSVAGPATDVSGAISGSFQSLDKYSRNLVQTLFSQELAIGRTIQKESNKISSTISGGVEQLTDGLDTVSKDLNELFKPVSTALGSTLGTLTGMAKDPLGSLTLLPRTLGDVVEKVSPKFAARLEASYKKMKLDNFAHLPTQVMGGIKNLLTAADALLSLPLQLISDLYQGLMSIMQSIADAVDQLMSSIMNFFFGPGGLLDSIFPISEILAFLEAIGELASEIGGIAGTFLNTNEITGYANTLQTYTGQLGSFLQNPMDLVSAYLPEQVSQGLYTLRNPEQLVNSIIPPQLTQQFATLSKITGFGFNGNMGYGFQSVLEGLKGGVISSILTNFASQYAILTPLLNANTPPLNGSTNPSLDTALTGGQPVAQGVVQQQTPPAKPIADKQAASADATKKTTPTTNAPTQAPATSGRTTTGQTNAVAGVTVGGGVQAPTSIFDLQGG